MTDRYECFHYGRNFFKQLVELIENAQQEILINVYNFEYQLCQGEIFEALKRKASQGIKVRILLDGYSQVSDAEKTAAVFINCGISVKIFRKGKWMLVRHPFSFFYRNHARIFLIDRKILGLGGMGLAKIYTNRQDFFIFKKIQSAEAGFAKDFFDALWKAADYSPRKFINARGRAYSLLSSGPDRREQEIYDWLLNRIGTAKNRIVITSAWILPSWELIQSLIAAKQRGVSVEIYAPVGTDQGYYDYFRILPAHFLLDNGIRWYLVGRYFHQKVFLIDETWCVGSANFDIVSLQRNFELNMYGKDRAVYEEVVKSIQTVSRDARVLSRQNVPLFFRLFAKPLYWLTEYMFMPKFR